MNTGDRIKMFPDSDVDAYMRLVACNGFRPKFEDGYVIVGELYYGGEDKHLIGKSIYKARRELKMDKEEYSRIFTSQFSFDVKEHIDIVLLRIKNAERRAESEDKE